MSEVLLRRNVINPFKYWEEEAIKAYLDERRHNFSVVCQNLQHDFNIGSVIRNANAFLAKNVIIHGSRRWDRRGAVGTHHYERIKHTKSIEELKKEINNCCIISIDNTPEASPIEEFSFQKELHYAFIFGEENLGVDQELREISSKVLYIKQYGSVRSLNVGCASAIVMYDYVNKFKNL